jgi:dipeptidyl aminopeptidase/acylaminoacyl peptidase
VRRRRAVASVFGLVVVMAGCDESGPDGPGATDPCEPQSMIWVYSRITDAADPAHPSEVFRLDDGAESQLTDAASPPEREASSAAAVSPDGSRIAFQRGSEGDPESAGYTRHRLYVMSGDGSDAEPLFDPANEPPDADLAWDTNPVWSPDGSRLAFVRNVTPEFGSDAGAVHSVMVAPAEGGVPTAVSKDGSDHFDPAPAWSPDGTRLAWVTEQSSSLHWSTLDGKKAGDVRLPGATGAPAWIDGGRGILVAYQLRPYENDPESGVYRVDVDSGEYEKARLDFWLADLWALPTGQVAGVEGIRDASGDTSGDRIVVLDPKRPADREEIAAFDTEIEGIATAVPDDPDGWADCTGT